MACLTLGDAPKGTKYQDFAPWLRDIFFLRLCSYCLLQNEGVQVDHYEPQTFAPARIHDPTNLLFGCPRCNGAGGKSDYHPLHQSRRRMAKDTTGHLVIDVRSDDFAGMFAIAKDGSISGVGVERTRAIWNIVLLKLDLPFCNDARREVLELVEVCEESIVASFDLKRDKDKPGIDAALVLLLPRLARRSLFLEVFGIPMSEDLTRAVSGLRAEMRVKAVVT